PHAESGVAVVARRFPSQLSDVRANSHSTALNASPCRSRHALSWAPLTGPRGQAGEVRRAQGRFGAGGASAPPSGFELCGSSRGDATRLFTPSPRLQPHPVFAYLPARTSI